MGGARRSVDGGEHVALVKGEIDPDEDTLARVHQIDLTADLLGLSTAHRDYVPQALSAMATHPRQAVTAFVRDASLGSISKRMLAGASPSTIRRLIATTASARRSCLILASANDVADL
ncbi:hypothetical protein [Sphingomonas sp.]|uniref:hypothetical protein n=1 Tax=Sphingomonas sp. TaxID=28214 RepID=UPI003B0053E3